MGRWMRRDSKLKAVLSYFAPFGICQQLDPNLEIDPNLKNAVSQFRHKDYSAISNRHVFKRTLFGEPNGAVCKSLKCCFVMKKMKVLDENRTKVPSVFFFKSPDFGDELMKSCKKTCVTFEFTFITMHFGPELHFWNYETQLKINCFLGCLSTQSTFTCLLKNTQIQTLFATTPFRRKVRNQLLTLSDLLQIQCTYN